MVCLTTKEELIAAAKATADAEKGVLDGAMGSLRGLNPGDFSTKAEFEAAKNSAISTTKGALDTYKGALGAVNAAGSEISPVSGTALDELAITNSLSSVAIVTLIMGLIKPINDNLSLGLTIPVGEVAILAALPAIVTAVLAQQSLQCTP